MILLTHILLVVVIMLLVFLCYMSWIIHARVCHILFIAREEQLAAGGGGGDLTLNDLDEAIDKAGFHDHRRSMPPI